MFSLSLQIIQVSSWPCSYTLKLAGKIVKEDCGWISSWIKACFPDLHTVMINSWNQLFFPHSSFMLGVWLPFFVIYQVRVFLCFEWSFIIFCFALSLLSILYVEIVIEHQSSYTDLLCLCLCVFVCLCVRLLIQLLPDTAPCPPPMWFPFPSQRPQRRWRKLPDTQRLEVSLPLFYDFFVCFTFQCLVKLVKLCSNSSNCPQMSNHRSKNTLLWIALFGYNSTSCSVLVPKAGVPVDLIVWSLPFSAHLCTIFFLVYAGSNWFTTVDVDVPWSWTTSHLVFHNFMHTIPITSWNCSFCFVGIFSSVVRIMTEL